MAIMTVSFASKTLNRYVTFNAIVPVEKSLETGATTTKTLYLLHGMHGTHTDWMTNTRIAAWAQEKNLTVIMPAGENGFYVDNPHAGLLYGEFIGRELVEVTRKMFPLSQKREDTFLAGLSMGGYGAIRNGLKYAETFGYVAGLSSALIVDGAVKSEYQAEGLAGNRHYFEATFGDLTTLLGSDMDYKALVLDLQQKKVEIPALYLTCGTEDFLIEQNRDYHRFLVEHQVPVTYVEAPGVHDWYFWDTHIQRVLEWLPL